MLRNEFRLEHLSPTKIAAFAQHATDPPPMRKNTRLMPTLMDRLREETRESHERLEAATGLSAETATRERVAHLLVTMHGFLQAWEPWALATPEGRRLLEGRRKVETLDGDLKRMGLPVPTRTTVAIDGVATPGTVVGSFYVIEGSTLGGLLINKWIKSSTWVPDGGLSYFDMYGRNTKRMWNAFIQRAEAMIGIGQHEDAVRGALSTFERLHDLARGEITTA